MISLSWRKTSSIIASNTRVTRVATLCVYKRFTKAVTKWRFLVLDCKQILLVRSKQTKKVIATTFLSDLKGFIPRATPQIFFVSSGNDFSIAIIFFTLFLSFVFYTGFCFPFLLFLLWYLIKKSLRSTRHLFHVPIPLFCSCRFHLNKAVFHNTHVITYVFDLRSLGSALVCCSVQN